MTITDIVNKDGIKLKRSIISDSSSIDDFL